MVGPVLIQHPRSLARGCPQHTVPRTSSVGCGERGSAGTVLHFALFLRLGKAPFSGSLSLGTPLGQSLLAHGTPWAS